MDQRPLPVLSSYVAHVRRHWLLLLVTTLIGALIGSWMFFSLPIRYFATSRVAMSPQITYLSLDTTTEKEPLVTLDTTAALLRSDEAIGKLADVMGVSRSAAADSLVISAKPGSRVLVVQVRADTRAQAVDGANSATESLLALQSDEFALSSRRVRQLKTRINVLRNQALESIAEGAPAQGQLQTVTILQGRLDRAVDTNNTDSAVIMRAKVVTYRPGQAEVFIAGGLTLGLLLGIFVTLVPRPKRQPRPARHRRFRAPSRVRPV